MAVRHLLPWMEKAGKVEAARESTAAGSSIRLSSLERVCAVCALKTAHEDGDECECTRNVPVVRERGREIATCNLCEWESEEAATMEACGIFVRSEGTEALATLCALLAGACR